MAGLSQHYQYVTIAAGQSITAAINLGSYRLAAIVLPAAPAWTAAPLSFQAANALQGAPDTFYDLYDAAGNEYQVPIQGGRFVSVPKLDFEGVQYLKLRSGSTNAPVNQANAITLTLIYRPRGVHGL